MCGIYIMLPNRYRVNRYRVNNVGHISGVAKTTLLEHV